MEIRVQDPGRVAVGGQVRRPGDARGGRTRYDAYDAVVTGRTSPRGRNARGQPIVGQYRLLRVWVKRRGRWRHAVALQGTRVASP